MVGIRSFGDSTYFQGALAVSFTGSVHWDNQSINQSIWINSIRSWFMTHSTHVWHIYLHLPKINYMYIGKLVNVPVPWMVWVMIQCMVSKHRISSVSAPRQGYNKSTSVKAKTVTLPGGGEFVTATTTTTTTKTRGFLRETFQTAEQIH